VQSSIGDQLSTIAGTCRGAGKSKQVHMTSYATESNGYINCNSGCGLHSHLTTIAGHEHKTCDTQPGLCQLAWPSGQHAEAFLRHCSILEVAVEVAVEEHHHRVACLLLRRVCCWRLRAFKCTESQADK